MISAPITTDFAALYKELYHLHRDDVETTNLIKELEVKSVVQKHQSTQWNWWGEKLEDMGNLTEGWSSTVPLTAGKATKDLMDKLRKFMTFDNITVYLAQHNTIRISFEFEGEKYAILASANGGYMLYKGKAQSSDQKFALAEDNAKAVRKFRKWTAAPKTEKAKKVKQEAK